MSALSDQIQADATQLHTDVAIQRAIVNGPIGSGTVGGVTVTDGLVTTEGGDVKTLAKAISEIEDVAGWTPLIAAVPYSLLNAGSDIYFVGGTEVNTASDLNTFGVFEGMEVVGTNIEIGTTISDFTDGNTIAYLSQSITGSVTGVVAFIGTGGLLVAFQVVDWTGGSGTKPGIGNYLGASGFVADIRDATNVRGATGATGATGSAGSNGTNGTNGTNGVNAEMTRASTTSLAIATGSKAFTFTATASNLGWSFGTRLRAASAANTANFMEGAVTAVSTSAVTILVDATGGSGTLSDWNISIGGGTALGTGVAAALAINVGSAGAPVVFNGAGGTPSSLTLTNASGTAASVSIGGSSGSLSVSGQTGLFSVTGLTSTNRIKTFRDAADTVLELGGNYTPTGTWTNLTLVTPAIGSATGTSLTLGTNSSTGGTLNLANAALISWRNGANSANGSYIYSDSANAIILAPNASQAVFFKSNGNVVFNNGTESNNGKLQVYGSNIAINYPSLATTSTDGALLNNVTAATVGTQVQISPRLRFSGSAWKSNATAASQVNDGIMELRPVAGAASTSGVLWWSFQSNGGGYTDRMSLSDTGVLKPTGVVSFPNYTVATLPSTAAAGMVQGAVCCVTDALAPAWNVALTGGGAVHCGARYNGSAWVAC